MPTRLHSTRLSILTLLATGALAVPASGQEATADPSTPAGDAASVTELLPDVVSEEPDVAGRDALAYNAQLLDEVLELSTKRTIKEQKFAAAAGISGGMIMIGLAAWRLIEKDPQSQYSRGLGVMFMTLGMADLTTGVYAATRIPHERHRLARWQKVRKDGVTAVELAHFEGELQASREMRQGERLLVRWTGLTHALAGAMVLASTPIPDSLSSTDRVSGYVIGGLFLAVGMAAFGATFRETPSEKAWDDYVARKASMPGHEFHWGLAPSFSKRGAGLSFGGIF
ncbi:MAG: hypothetical protein E4H00_03100 [Myxococcales bacterium]|nr:MAG: hypothetical protein E4H00_03100 [Myxococcales bacterium]